MKWTYYALGIGTGLVIGYLQGYFRGVSDTTAKYNDELQSLRETREGIRNTTGAYGKQWGDHR